LATLVRLASTPAEREQVFGLRYRIYVEELGGLFSDEADHDRKQLSDDVDESSRLLMATIEDEIVGTLRLTLGADGPFPPELRDEYRLETFLDLIPPEEMVVFTRFMVATEQRGSDVPIELMRAVVTTTAENQLQLAFCDCEPHLLGLYSSLGFRSYCGAFHSANSDVLFPLVLINDQQYLEQIGSPLLAWGLGGTLEPETRRTLVERLPEVAPVRPLDLSSAEWATEFARLSSQRSDSTNVFAGLGKHEVDDLLKRSQILELDPGAGLIRKGQVSRNVYVVLSGELDVHDGDRRVRGCGEGQVVGDVAFFTREARTLDVDAGPDGASVLSISERSLHELIESQSRTAAVLLLNLARTGARRLARAGYSEVS
jgi:predicted GNAT family N-acyltransferase